jgi:hypothetical protein
MSCLYRHDVQIPVAEQNEPISPGVLAGVAALDVVINFFGAGAFDFESASISCGNGAFEMLLEPGTGSTITTTKSC